MKIITPDMNEQNVTGQQVVEAADRFAREYALAAHDRGMLPHFARHMHAFLTTTEGVPFKDPKVETFDDSAVKIRGAPPTRSVITLNAPGVEVQFTGSYVLGRGYEVSLEAKTEQGGQKTTVNRDFGLTHFSMAKLQYSAAGGLCEFLLEGQNPMKVQQELATYRELEAKGCHVQEMTPYKSLQRLEYIANHLMGDLQSSGIVIPTKR